MFGWLKRRRIGRRAYEYLQRHPEDRPIVDIVFSTHALLGEGRSVREMAGMAGGRKIGDAEWAEIGPRWERAFYFIWER